MVGIKSRDIERWEESLYLCVHYMEYQRNSKGTDRNKYSDYFNKTITEAKDNTNEPWINILKKKDYSTIMMNLHKSLESIGCVESAGSRKFINETIFN